MVAVSVVLVWHCSLVTPVCVPQLLDVAFGAKAPRVLYLCGADHLLMCGPQTLKDYGCICCSRPGNVHLCGSFFCGGCLRVHRS